MKSSSQPSLEPKVLGSEGLINHGQNESVLWSVKRSLKIVGKLVKPRPSVSGCVLILSSRHFSEYLETKM